MRKTTRFFLLGAALSMSHTTSAAWSDLLDVIARGRDEARIRMIDLHSLVEMEARRHGLSPAYVAAILQIESAGRPCVISRAGAMGLGQLMPATAARYGVSDPFEPITNVRATVEHLAGTLRIANGDPQLAAAIYNAGEKVMYLRPSRWPEETRNYVVRLRQLLPVYAGKNWRRYLVRYVPHVDYGLCARERMS